MNRLYLIRHGKPAAVWGGRDMDPGLDPVGQEQARAAAEALMAMPPAKRPRYVVSSPLRRCQETALPLAGALGVHVDIDPAVGEIPTPAGLKFEERPAWLRRSLTGGWLEIEGDIDYEAWRHAVTAAVARRPATAVFSHFVAINAVLSVLTGDPRVISFHPDHASITTLDLVDGRLTLVEQGREAATGVL